METDMACIDGKAHDFKLVNGQYICRRAGCEHVSPYCPVDLASENRFLRKMLEDICECQGNLDELIEEARNTLQTL